MLTQEQLAEDFAEFVKTDIKVNTSPTSISEEQSEDIKDMFEEADRCVRHLIKMGKV